MLTISLLFGEERWENNWFGWNRFLLLSVISLSDVNIVLVLVFVSHIFWESFLNCLVSSLLSDDDELFLRNGWRAKGVKPYFQPGPLLKILTIASLQHAAGRIWTCAEPEHHILFSDSKFLTNFCSKAYFFLIIVLQDFFKLNNWFRRKGFALPFLKLWWFILTFAELFCTCHWNTYFFLVCFWFCI